jgi:two-component system LytT family response regulator
MLKAVIVDDEDGARNVLRMIIAANCPEVEVVGEAADVPKAVQIIQQHEPDLVFLDIEMPGYTGFQLLDFFNNPNFYIIFTTAYSQHALKAFEVSAIDYLLKPIDEDKLIVAIEKVKKISLKTTRVEQLAVLKKTLAGDTPDKIAVPVAEGLLFVNLKDIEYLEASGSYTHLYLHDGSKLLISKKLGEFEPVLTADQQFFRPHRSFIINLLHLKQYVRQDGGHIMMHNGGNVPISRDNKDEFQLLIEGMRI